MLCFLFYQLFQHFINQLIIPSPLISGSHIQGCILKKTYFASTAEKHILTSKWRISSVLQQMYVNASITIGVFVFIFIALRHQSFIFFRLQIHLKVFFHVGHTGNKVKISESSRDQSSELCAAIKKTLSYKETPHWLFLKYNNFS